MYDRILLAYDGSLTGRAALREGALLAKSCGAQVFLLSVVAATGGMRVAEGAHAGVLSSVEGSYQAILDEGVARLKALGFEAVAKLVVGEPVQEIGAFARQIKADLVVVGHRRRGLIERWWSGASGGYIVDNVACSVLISRNVITDEQFAAKIRAIEARVIPRE